jgi:drug/metabolite transporter (DMT)-like permease
MAEETWAAIGMAFTGLGVVVGGCAGLLLPKQRRLGVLFALTAGAGIGLTVLALGTVIGEYEPSLFMIFLAGFLGFLTVCLGVWFAATSPRWGRYGDRWRPCARRCR